MSHHLQQVFSVLRQHQLFVKFKKCVFAQNQIEYLGHIISDVGVATDPSRTTTMLQWPVPHIFIELRGCFGLTEYYRKFIKNYGIIAKPLTQQLQHKQFEWTPEAQEAFESLKQAMSSTPALTLLDFEQQFIIETDACDKGVGAVLSQNGHPVAFFSKALSKTDQKLFTYEKEFLDVLMAVDKWHSYLSRQPFLIKTNHQSLCHLQDQSLSIEIQRKAMVKLAGLQFKFQVADALSRVSYIFLTQSTSAVVPIWIQEILNSYTVDETT
jgi:hypothetical protein